MNEILQTIKTMLGVTNQDELLIKITGLVESKILSYLKVDILPTKFEWILIELSIQRFNRIGSEGFSSESVDGDSTSYLDDELAPYYKFLDSYTDENGNTTRKGYKLF